MNTIVEFFGFFHEVSFAYNRIAIVNYIMRTLSLIRDVV